MKEPLVNNWCFCWDLKIGNIVNTILQVLGCIYNIFKVIMILQNPVSQDDLKELIKRGERVEELNALKDIMNVPECKLNLC